MNPHAPRENSMSRSTAFVLTAIIAVACSKSSGKITREAPPKSELPDKYLLANEPADAKPVLAAKSVVKDGERVAVTGKVHDFVSGLSAFVITDPALKTCDQESPMSTCPTPWDYCCTDSAEVAAASATIEVREGERVLKTGARGFHGLDYMAQVTVTGQAQTDAKGNLTVIADGIYIRP